MALLRRLRLKCTDDIGNAFLANAAASALVAAYIVLRPDRLGLLAGIVLSAGTLVAFVLARQGDGILDFRETGMNPSPEALLTLIVEVAAIVLLVGSMLASVVQPRRSRCRPTSSRRRRSAHRALIDRGQLAHVSVGQGRRRSAHRAPIDPRVSWRTLLHVSRS